MGNGARERDLDDVQGGWVEMIREQYSMGASYRAEGRPGPPPPEREDWPRPRRFGGLPTRVICLVSAVSVDGWDLVVDEPRIFPRQLADELISARQVRLAELGE